MAGRAFAFADPKIIALCKTQFVPVCADDWYQRRRQDAEGEFFRAMASQGPRKGVGGSTRQGIYVLTADGDLLAFKNAGQDVDATTEQLTQGLKKWAALPKNRREPGAVTIPAVGKLDEKFARVPPDGGLIVRVHGRILDLKDGKYVRGTCDQATGTKASRDFLWLTADDVKALAPPQTAVGFAYPLAPAVARRIARFHLVDNTRGEPFFWKKPDVREVAVTLTVTAATATAVDLRLEGVVKLADKNRGYEPVLNGTLRYRPATRSFDLFDIVAVGEHWGDDTVTQTGSRPGRTPYGVAFGLADPKVPAERVAPQAARERDSYLGTRDD